MAYLGRRGTAAPLNSSDIPAGIVEGTDIAFLENASTTQNLNGTYSTERMYLNDSYTLIGDINVTGHLALGSIADADIVITQDSTERTITGSGTLDAGNVLQDTHRTSLTGMTGELGSAVTLGTGVIGQATAKAWVNFNGTNTVAIRDSFNVSSVTDEAAGKYKITFTTKLSNSNYSVTSSHSEDTSLYSTHGAGSRVATFNSSRTTSLFYVSCSVDEGAFTDMGTVELQIFGD